MKRKPPPSASNTISKLLGNVNQEHVRQVLDAQAAERRQVADAALRERAVRLAKETNPALEGAGLLREAESVLRFLSGNPPPPDLGSGNMGDN